MMHYTKGENVEEELTKENLPFGDCWSKGQKDFLWMHVKGGSKVSNLINYAKKSIDNGEYRSVVWSGSDGGVVKTISCAEILKRSYPLNQVTRLCYRNVEEHWIPKMEGLEEIVAKRQIPCIHILMSLDEIDIDSSEVQKPNTQTSFWNDPTTSSALSTQNNRSQQRRANQREGATSSRGANDKERNRRKKKQKPQADAQPQQRQSENSENADQIKM